MNPDLVKAAALPMGAVKRSLALGKRYLSRGVGERGSLRRFLPPSLLWAASRSFFTSGLLATGWGGEV
eukprot:1463010-Amphidinium_carterae.1